MTRVSVAAGTGRRGAGLGNELVPYAKAYLAADALGLRLVRPWWTGSRYHLPAAFGWGRAVALSNATTSLLPRFEVTEALYRSTGIVDYGGAVRALAEDHDLRLHRRLAVVSRGMWGGYPCIAAARPFLVQQLHSAPHVVEALVRAHLPALTDVVVAFHVRRGDFAGGSPGPGQFNLPVPISWFTFVARQFREALGDRVRMLVLSDGDREALSNLLAVPGTVLVGDTESAGHSRPLCDLAILASADALVCSVSSFSMSAAFLSNNPYVWFEPQLVPRLGGLSMWGHEPAQRARASGTPVVDRRPDDQPRGWPVRVDGPFPDQLLAGLEQLARRRNVHADLLHYGVVKQ